MSSIPQIPYGDKPFNGDTCLADEFLRLKQKYNSDIAVETGTFTGATTRWLAEHFKKVFTCEIAEEYLNEAYKNLTGLDNIDMYHGSSIDALPLFLNQCNNQTIFFLDAHWGAFNPLHSELKAIEDAKLRPIIIIHDFFVPMKSESGNPQGDFGYDTYPAEKIIYQWGWIERRVEKIYGKDRFTKYYNEKVAENSARRGCLFIEPA